MERIIHFEQFYYTNYGQGMRFEGNSTETARTASALELLAANWMKQELNEPVEMVLYNSHLGCYVSAMTVPCTQTGDARTSYWIHAVMPDEKESGARRTTASRPEAVRVGVRSGGDEKNGGVSLRFSFGVRGSLPGCGCLTRPCRPSREPP